MNTIIESEPPAEPFDPQDGELFKNELGIYILGEFDNKFFLVNLESGSTYNGFKKTKEELFANTFGEFKKIKHPITLTPHK